MAVFAALVVWSCRTPVLPTTSRQGWRLAAEFSLVIIGMLLFSERTWKHHCVTLLLPFAVLSYQLALGDERRVYLVGSLVAAHLLMTATSISLLGRDVGKLAQVYGAYVAAFGVLLAALAVVLRQPRAQSALCAEAALLRKAG